MEIEPKNKMHSHPLLVDDNFVWVGEKFSFDFNITSIVFIYQ